jgi:hypothetical protein
MSELVSRRYQSKSTRVTTDRPLAEWREVFPNGACVVSLVDCLVHDAEIIAIEGDSYRLRKLMTAPSSARGSGAEPSHERVAAFAFARASASRRRANRRRAR